MTETIRLIINELAKEPFKKNFTVISFDSLKPELLLQVLNDVLAAIEPANKLDIREEGVEQTVVRILNMLRVLKYRPPEDNASALRSGLVSGTTKVIHPILAWLLPRIEELKTRAYLARFLVKLDIPQDIRSDMDVEELYQQYDAMMDQFKNSHKQLETMKSRGFTTSEIRKDIEAMEQEQESVTRKIEKMKRRAEGIPNIESTLEVVQLFRKEKEQARELDQQSVAQSQAVNQADQRIQRLQRQLKEIRAANTGSTAEGILQRLEQDTDVAKYIVNEKLPKEIEARRKEVNIFQRVMSETALTPKDLENTKNSIDAVKSEVNELVMKRMMRTEDDKLVMFRQQAAIVANRKSTLVEKLNDHRSELTTLKEEEAEKKQQLSAFAGDVTMKEEDFKEYVKNLRVKSTRYKQMKAELSFLKAECGILAKTVYIAEEELKNTSIDLAALEARLGIKGFVETQETIERISSEKSQMDEQKSKNLQQMSSAVQELHEKISMKKVDLAPLVKNLNAVRQQAQIIGHEHEALKRKYDSIATSIESNMSTLTKEVEGYRKKYLEDQLKYCKLQSQLVVHKVDLKKIQEELKNYATSGGNNQERKKSYKEQIVAKVSEQERLIKTLKEEEKLIVSKQAERVNQAAMWRDLVKLLELKRRLKEASKYSN